MTESEYYYDLELLELLEHIVKIIPGRARMEDFLMSRIDNLKERLDDMFKGERKETDE